jgi:hypothetical protein
MMESFWGRMQTELLDRRRWKTRIELANAIFDDRLGIHDDCSLRLSPSGKVEPHELTVAR